MSKKELHVEIAEFLFRPHEIRMIEFTYDCIYRKKSESILEEIYFYAQLGLINNSVICPQCSNRMHLILKKQSISISGFAKNLVARK
jgi:hypothetical protein